MATITGPSEDVSGWVYFQQKGHRMTVTGEVCFASPAYICPVPLALYHTSLTYLLSIHLVPPSGLTTELTTDQGPLPEC